MLDTSVDCPVQPVEVEAAPAQQQDLDEDELLAELTATSEITRINAANVCIIAL